MKTVFEALMIKQVRAVKQYARKHHLSLDSACDEWVKTGLAKKYREAVNERKIY